MITEQRPSGAAQRGTAPVAGLKILDFTHVFAGPFCTRTLADLGADVAHVESRSRDPGDRYRAAYTHRNKRSICLDLKSEAGHALAVQLARQADVVVENFSSGVMKRLKLDYETLAADNPRLIFISLSGYGHTGPRSAWTSMNMNLQAYTGLMLTTGAEGDPPTSISNSWNDYIGGLHGVIAILQALGERTQSGRGRHIDLSQFECSVATLGALLMSSAVSGQPPKRWGNRSSSAAPQGAYPCSGKDEWCTLSVQTDAQWHALAAIIGLRDEERYATATGRFEHHDALDAAIGTWTAQRSPQEVEATLHAAGIPAERMRRVAELISAPDSAQGFRELPSEHERSLLSPTLPFQFSRSTIEPVVAPAKLGQHTGEILRDWLGLDAVAIEDLEARAAFS